MSTSAVATGTECRCCGNAPAMANSPVQGAYRRHHREQAAMARELDELEARRWSPCGRAAGAGGTVSARASLLSGREARGTGTRKFRRRSRPVPPPAVVALARPAEPVLEQLKLREARVRCRFPSPRIRATAGVAYRMDRGTPPKKANAALWPSQNASVVSVG